MLGCSHGVLPNYYSFEELMSFIPEVAGKMQGIIDSAQFKTAAGSSHNHQAWPGGYLDHVCETMNIAVWLYRTSPRSLPFTLEEALTVMFLHDLEKPFKGQFSWPTKEDRRNFRDTLIQQNGVCLSSAQVNAFRYVEGEFDDYSNSERRMGPLAAFCHMCDIASARLWHSHGKECSW